MRHQIRLRYSVDKILTRRFAPRLAAPRYARRRMQPGRQVFVREEGEGHAQFVLEFEVLRGRHRHGRRVAPEGLL